MTENQAMEAVILPESNHYESCLNFALSYVNVARGTFTSEDLKAAYTARLLPEPREPRVWGAVIKSLSRSKLIIPIGWATYRGKLGHSKPSRIWRAAIVREVLHGIVAGGKQEVMFVNDRNK